MEIKRVCPHCGKMKTLTSENLLKADVHSEKGYIRVCYFVCAGCGEKVVVQVDNQATRELYGKLKILLVRCMRKSLKKETISPKDVKKREKWSKQLARMRKDLSEDYAGETLYDEHEQIFIRGLTVLESCDTI